MQINLQNNGIQLLGVDGVKALMCNGYHVLYLVTDQKTKLLKRNESR